MMAATRVLALAIVVVAACTACGHSSPLRASLRATAFVTLPPPTNAFTPLVEVVAIRTARGPAAPATTVEATGGCPAGAVLVGGGVNLALMGGGTAPSSLHMGGSHPSGSNGNPVTAPGVRPAAWTAVGATGGQMALGAGTTAFAVCVQGGVATSEVAVAGIAGPAVAATTARATATCPPRTSLLGGGALTNLTSHGPPSPSLHLTGSFPSSPDGSPVAVSGATARSWTAVADAGGRTGAGVETTAFAVCGAVGRSRTQVALSTRPGPLTPGGVTAATASCPAGTVLLSGGVNTGPANGQPQQGLHLTGSFPSSPAGDPVTASGTNASAWTGRAEAGGQGSPAGTATTAFAVCTAR